MVWDLITDGINFTLLELLDICSFTESTGTTEYLPKLTKTQQT